MSIITLTELQMNGASQYNFQKCCFFVFVLSVKKLTELGFNQHVWKYKISQWHFSVRNSNTTEDVLINYRLIKFNKHFSLYELSIYYEILLKHLFHNQESLHFFLPVLQKLFRIPLKRICSTKWNFEVPRSI